MRYYRLIPVKGHRMQVIDSDGWGRAGNRFPTGPFGTVRATFTAPGYLWVVGPLSWIELLRITPVVPCLMRFRSSQTYVFIHTM